jgi:hypothetical protein
MTSVGAPRLHCECGSSLRWELRDAHIGQTRWLATCTSPLCGRIMTREGAGADPLKDFLLGPLPVHPYTSPWMRLFLRSSHAGFKWHAHDLACWSCQGSVTVALDLDRLRGREGDPDRAAVCLSCGALALRFFGWPDLETVLLPPWVWERPDFTLRAFLCALRERAPEDAVGMAPSDHDEPEDTDAL